MTRDWMFSASGDATTRALLAAGALVVTAALAGVWYLWAGARQAPARARPPAAAPAARSAAVPQDNSSPPSLAATPGRPAASSAAPPLLENGEEDAGYPDEAYGPESEVVLGRPERWASQVLAFERADKLTPPPAGATLFIGGSSIRLWHSLARDMTPVPVLQRGFGGARLADVLHFAPRLILAYKPQAVVLYAGDNDLGAYRAEERRTPQQVFEDFQRLAALLREQLPGATLYFASIKPSPQRWQHWGRMQEANKLIADFVKGKPGLAYIDVSSGLLKEDGTPRRELFRPDGLHLNAEGYQVWRRAVRVALGLKEGQP